VDGSAKPSSTDLDALARDCDIEFTRAGGPGGQHRNKAETAVRVTHRPSGVTLVASERRSQARNKMFALKRLADKLAGIVRERLLSHQRENRPATRPTKAANQRRLQQKRQLGEKKRARGKLRHSTDE
jgi:ribosome-associated protein